ncbi:hypothetical protein ACJX0J_017755, partial [Zea mays]
MKLILLIAINMKWYKIWMRALAYNLGAVKSGRILPNDLVSQGQHRKSREEPKSIHMHTCSKLENISSNLYAIIYSYIYDSGMHKFLPVPLLGSINFSWLRKIIVNTVVVQNRLGIKKWSHIGQVPSSGRGTFLLGAGRYMDPTYLATRAIQRIVFLVNLFMIYNQFSALLDEGGVYNLKFYKPWFTYYNCYTFLLVATYVRTMFTTRAGCSTTLDIQLTKKEWLVIVKVLKIDRSWWYNACKKCLRTTKPHGDTYKCTNNSCDTIGSPTP